MFVLLLNRERKQINIHLFIIRNIFIGQQDQISYGEQITILPMVVFACQMGSKLHLASTLAGTVL